MQDILLALVVFGGISTVFMTIFGYFGFLRYLKHKETMALAEKGLLKPESVVQYNGKNGRDKRLLNRAIILIAIGFALCLGLYPIGFGEGDTYPLYLGPWMIAGFLPLFFGIALLIIYALPLLPSLLNQLVTAEHRGTADEASDHVPVEEAGRAQENDPLPPQ